MKTLLIATDCSANAWHAAEYGYRLASHLGANLILCNAFIVPVETADHPNIYYRVVKSNMPEQGLDGLNQYGHIDVLVMIRREHGLLGKIFTGSHTQKKKGRTHAYSLIASRQQPYITL